MPLQVTSDNLEITPSMRALAEQKASRILNKLSEIPEDLVDLRVVMNKGSSEGTFETKVALKISGKTLVSEKTEFNLESSIIDAVEDTLRQYEKEKSKNDSDDWQQRRDLKVFHDPEAD